VDKRRAPYDLESVQKRRGDTEVIFEVVARTFSRQATVLSRPVFGDRVELGDELTKELQGRGSVIFTKMI
jgi:hypothetical protein